MKIPGNSLGLALAVAMAPSAALAFGDALRTCSYEIRVKSDRPSIPSTTLPGEVIARGFADGNLSGAVSGLVGVNTVAGMARTHAARHARDCMNAAWASSTPPPACAPGRKANRSAGWSEIRFWPFGNLRETATAALCREAARRGHGDRARLLAVTVYAFRRGEAGGADVRCSFGYASPYSRYLTLQSNFAIQCAPPGAPPGQTASVVQGTANTWSGWYLKSGSGLRSYIANACRTRFGANDVTIHRYQVQQDTGKLRAQFTCR